MSKGLLIPVVATLGLATGATVCANPIAPVYEDFPVSGSDLESWVAGPGLADDFEAGRGERIAYAEWWGSFTDGAWELTLYPNVDADPAAPDEAGRTVVVMPQWVDPWGDEVFRYAADVSAFDWSVAAGESYWFGVESVVAGWTWALADGLPDFGTQAHPAVVSMAGGPGWEPAVPSSQLAFGLWPVIVPEPGTLPLFLIAAMGLGFGALGSARARAATHRVARTTAQAGPTRSASPRGWTARSRRPPR